MERPRKAVADPEDLEKPAHKSLPLYAQIGRLNFSLKFPDCFSSCTTKIRKIGCCFGGYETVYQVLKLNGATQWSHSLSLRIRTLDRLGN